MQHSLKAGAVVGAAALAALVVGRPRPEDPAPEETMTESAERDSRELERAESLPGAPVGFTLVSRYRIPSGYGAEILALDPSGQRLAYSNGDRGTVDIVDVSNPVVPRLAREIRVADLVDSPGAGEPTSVDITPNGRFALVAIKDTRDPIGSTDPGVLAFIDLDRLEVTATIEIGVGPDSIKITPDGKVAIIAIEDEEDPQSASREQQRPGSIDFVVIDYDDPARSTRESLPLAPDVGNNRRDPQPEYVDVDRHSRVAVVSLQENNVAAIVDIDARRVIRYIDLGTVRLGQADLRDDGEIHFSLTQVEGRREPDAVCILPGGEHFLTANEGDTSAGDFIPDQLSGGGGFTIFDIEGNLDYEVGSQLEVLASRHGMYPDTRSDSRGIEVEGCTVAQIGGRDFAFLVAERASMLTVFDVGNPTSPRYVQVLPAPWSPEGVAIDQERGLVYVGGEGVRGGGGIWIYRAVYDEAESEQYPDGIYRAVSEESPLIHFGGISGLTWTGVPGRFVAVTDAAFARARLWTFVADRRRDKMLLEAVLYLQRAPGVPLDGYDPEGLGRNPEGGWVLASEGRARNGCTDLRCPEQHRNRLIFVDHQGLVETTPPDGIVDLPAGKEENAIDWDQIDENGFGGVAVVDRHPTAPGGLVAYALFQRPLHDGPGGEGSRNLVRIGAYDVDRRRWDFYFYPLGPAPDDAGPVLAADIAVLPDGRFAILERDELRGSAARYKRIYTLEIEGPPNDPRRPLDKHLLSDLLEHPFRIDFAKIDGMTATDDSLMLVNDSDGGEVATFFVEVPASPASPRR